MLKVKITTDDIKRHGQVITGRANLEVLDNGLRVLSGNVGLHSDDPNISIFNLERQAADLFIKQFSEVAKKLEAEYRKTD